MNKIILDKEKNSPVYINEDTTIIVEENIETSITIWIENVTINIDILLKSNSSLILNILNINCNLNLNVSYDSRKSKFYLNNSIINYKDVKIKLDILHNYPDTISNVINHGININDGNLEMDINAKVTKGSKMCSLLQDNKIINLNNGKSRINPNLLIDEFDTSANHSAYISKFNDEDIFYLQSRGIREEDSLYLLMKAFLINRMNLEEDIKSKFIEEINKIERRR